MLSPGGDLLAGGWRCWRGSMPGAKRRFSRRDGGQVGGGGVSSRGRWFIELALPGGVDVGERWRKLVKDRCRAGWRGCDGSVFGGEAGEVNE